MQMGLQVRVAARAEMLEQRMCTETTGCSPFGSTLAPGWVVYLPPVDVDGNWLYGGVPR